MKKSPNYVRFSSNNGELAYFHEAVRLSRVVNKLNTDIRDK